MARLDVAAVSQSAGTRRMETASGQEMTRWCSAETADVMLLSKHSARSREPAWSVFLNVLWTRASVGRVFVESAPSVRSQET
jgi:hypothetical protein